MSTSPIPTTVSPSPATSDLDRPATADLDWLNAKFAALLRELQDPRDGPTSERTTKLLNKFVGQCGDDGDVAAAIVSAIWEWIAEESPTRREVEEQLDAKVDEACERLLEKTVGYRDRSRGKYSSFKRRAEDAAPVLPVEPEAPEPDDSDSFSRLRPHLPAWFTADIALYGFDPDAALAEINASRRRSKESLVTAKELAKAVEAAAVAAYPDLGPPKKKRKRKKPK